MKFSKELIMGDEIQNKEEVLGLIKSKKNKQKFYFICISINSNNLFDIIDSLQIVNDYYINKDYTVIAVCKTKEGYKSVLKKIIEIHLSKGHDIHSLKQTLIYDL